MYLMKSTGKSEFALLDFKDVNGDLLKYFVLGLDVSRFCRGKKPRFFAQSYFNEININNFDFFQPTLPFPVFSRRAKDLMLDVISGIDFVSCEIVVGETVIEAFAGRVLNCKPLFKRVDDYYIEPIDGLQFSGDDWIVRDSGNEQFYVVTEQFKQFCLESSLKIIFDKFSLLR